MYTILAILGVVASSALGLGPQVAMQRSERLYPRGFISKSICLHTCHKLSRVSRLALVVELRLLADGYHKRELGTDAGDHPPITPMLSATEDMLEHDAWRLYEYVCQHLLEVCLLTARHHVAVKGFTTVMPWLAVHEKNLPQFLKGGKMDIWKVDLFEGSTMPPDFLSENDLISLMEKNGIGMDASIPVHISNICERNFVQIENKNALFEAQFSPLADSGRNLSKYGKCLQYMNAGMDEDAKHNVENPFWLKKGRDLAHQATVYWSSIFVLPKEVCKVIDQILGSFLWHGAVGISKAAKVAWDVVYPRKGKGVFLGLKRVHDRRKKQKMEIFTVGVAKMADYTVVPIARQVGYLYFYKSNLDELKTQIENLMHVRKRLQDSVDQALGNGEDWFMKVDKIGQVCAFLEDGALAKNKCFSGTFPNLALLSRLSKKAKKMARFCL
ncbi:hypothetical protein FNV43_RR00045 [Rhamnella rubrinervis]|uniref:DNA topoisomerase n=1 Tax=Rhamnella rubrinervis TaxID=2594499 RepID=A0A8K0MS13_9ROSA|nr:hypothetical protein FNV43_RR00045 [Rhamnella rubrinervis]